MDRRSFLSLVGLGGVSALALAQLPPMPPEVVYLPGKLSQANEGAVSFARLVAEVQRELARQIGPVAVTDESHICLDTPNQFGVYLEVPHQEYVVTPRTLKEITNLLAAKCKDASVFGQLEPAAGAPYSVVIGQPRQPFVRGCWEHDYPADMPMMRFDVLFG